MEVILKQDVKTLGRSGDVVKVKEGYARNFLLPQKKAVMADSGNRKLIEDLKRKQQLRAEKERQEAKELAEKISKLTCTITKQAGDEKEGKESKLFGSVTAMDIAQALAHEGLAIDKKDILLAEPIKQLGTYKVDVKLHTDVKATVTVKIVKQ